MPTQFLRVTVQARIPAVIEQRAQIFMTQLRHPSPFELSRERISEGSIFQKSTDITMTFQNFGKLLHKAMTTGDIQSLLVNLPLRIA
jgi:hypothetical protein